MDPAKVKQLGSKVGELLNEYIRNIVNNPKANKGILLNKIAGGHKLDVIKLMKQLGFDELIPELEESELDEGSEYFMSDVVDTKKIIHGKNKDELVKKLELIRKRGGVEYSTKVLRTARSLIVKEDLDFDISYLDDFMEESTAHKIIADKLKTMDNIRNVRIPTPAERRAQIEKEKKEKEQKMTEEVKEPSDLAETVRKIQGKHYGGSKSTDNSADIDDEDDSKETNIGAVAAKRGRKPKTKSYADFKNSPDLVKKWMGVKEEELTLEDFSIEELEEFVASEEFNQLDEVSKETLHSYISKAAVSVSDKRKKALDHWHKYNNASDGNTRRDNAKAFEKNQDAAERRSKSIGKAAAKLSKKTD